MYEYMVNHYVERIKHYAKSYLESPAGIRFKAAIEKNRRSNKALPTLNCDILREFEGAEGIKWSGPQVFDIFSILSGVTMTTEYETKVYIGCVDILI